MRLLCITKIFNLGDITNQSNKEHNKKRQFITDHPYRTFIIGGTGSGKISNFLI